MALQLNIETPFGIDATYHKVVALNYDFLSQKGQAIVNCYLNEDVADARPLHQIIVAINNPLLAIDDTALYNAVKLDPVFANATIV